MIRTVISLAPEEKKWLDRKSHEEHVSMAKLIRIAVQNMKKERESALNSFESLLAETKGLWKHGDALKYQRKLRNEWREPR